MGKNMDIIFILNKLKDKRKIFNSESDFQFSLAWEIKEFYKNADIRLEYCYDFRKNIRIDIVVKLDTKIYPIELKYKTKLYRKYFGDEWYYLKNHGAQDLGRYDYLKDIQRMELFSNEIHNFEKGFTIILTNDNSYWKKNKKGTVDEQFYLNENIIKTGLLKWGEHSSEGTKKNREKPIELNGKYKINWNDYSVINDNSGGIFKYCLCIVEKIKNVGKK